MEAVFTVWQRSWVSAPGADSGPPPGWGAWSIYRRCVTLEAALMWAGAVNEASDVQAVVESPLSPVT